MRDINCQQITETVSSLFQEACICLPEDVVLSLKRAREIEDSPLAKEVLDRILENSILSTEGKTPLCQDTGTAVVFIELGQEVHITGGDFYTAINEGAIRGYRQGYLRCSMVSRPYSDRINTNDNAPAVVHTEIVPGDKLKITVMPKGGGSENMSRLAMLSPAAGRQGIIDFVLKAIDEAGSNPCPPVIIGIGIGGTAEQAFILAKKALLRDVGKPSTDVEHAQLEADVFREVNKLGIGPMGYGGRTTALAVQIEVLPTHIACLPVAISLQCHSARHKEAII